MGTGIRSIPKSFRVLAAVAIVLALVYPLVEALDTSAVTDGDFELEALTILFVFGIFVALIRLVLLAIRLMLLGHSLAMTAERIWLRDFRPILLFVHPPGLVALRI
jgi:hypothetical protein